jgi:hypothetical protein
VWLPADAEVDGAGARYRLLALGLHVCPVAARGATLRADFCVGQRVGRLEGDGFGFDRNLDRSRLIYTLGVRGRGWLRVAGPVGLLLGVGAEAPLTRDRFHYVAADGSEPELFRMSPVIGIVELGAGVSLP